MRSQRALLLVLGLFAIALPQATKAQSVENSATYVSQADRDLTIRRVTIFPVTDNIEGIYARPIEAQLNTLVRASHRWDYIESGVAGQLPALIELEEKPELVKQSASAADVDAIFAASATRGPNGISIRLDLFMKHDGKLIAQEIVKDLTRFEIPAIKEQVNQLYRRLIAKLPYDGILLSRQGNRVTVNLGRGDGLKKDQTLTAVQIIAVNRHPKFNFLVSTEKEIFGTIKILKVDETLSFGAIVSEKERGAIQRFAKIAGLNPINYGEPDSLTPGSEKNASGRADAPVTFGENPKEWLPVSPPSFGQVSLLLGMGSFDSSVTPSGQSALEGDSIFYPSAYITGELWLNPNWIARTEIRQGIVSTSNPLSGSSPGTVNHLVSRYGLIFGHNFLLREDFFGPKIQVNGGYVNYNVKVDATSPVSFRNSSASGLVIGVEGSFPLFDEKIWYMGGGLNVFVGQTASEFKLFGERKVAENMRAIGNLDFSLYNSSADGAESSQKHVILSGGIVYMF